MRSNRYEGIIIHVSPEHSGTTEYASFIQHLSILHNFETEEWNPAAEILNPFEELFDISDLITENGIAELFQLEHIGADSLQQILSSMGISAARSLLFSDSPQSSSFAKDIGMNVVGIATQYDTEQFERADFVMKHFGDEILKQIF